MEPKTPDYKGTIQVKKELGENTNFDTVGTIKLFKCEQKKGETKENGFTPISPALKGYMGIDTNGDGQPDKYYVVSLW